MRDITALGITAHVSAARQGGIDSRQQIAFSMGFKDVTPRTKSNCFVYDYRRSLLAQEDDLRSRGKLANSSSHFHAIQRGETDVEQNQIGLQRRGVLHCLQTIRHFTDNKQFRTFLQLGTNKAAKPQEILNQHYSIRQQFITNFPS